MKSTSFRTFVFYPLLVLGFEFFLHEKIEFQFWFAPLLAWGYLQYRLVGVYRARFGGGGPGMDVPPERVVTSGPYAWCRNPMYLGHLIFLLGLALTLRSWLAGIILLASIPWFHLRALRDERRLRERFGVPYEEYLGRVRRWIPGLL